MNKNAFIPLHFADALCIKAYTNSNLELDISDYEHIIHSPEWYFVRSYLNFKERVKRDYPISLSHCITDIQFMADGLMKNLVFSDMDIPVSAWTLLEPMGSLGQQYLKVIFDKFAEEPFKVQELIKLYNACAGKEWKSYTSMSNVKENVFKSYKSLQKFYKMYLELASTVAKENLACVFNLAKNRNNVSGGYSNANPIKMSEHTYYMYIGTLDKSLDIVENLTFTEEFFSKEFFLRDGIGHSCIKGLVVDMGPNRKQDHPFVKVHESLINIVAHLQGSDDISLRILCNETLVALNIVFKKLTDKDGRFIFVEPTLLLSEFLKNSDILSLYKTNPYSDRLVDAVSVLENWEMYSTGEVCHALTIATEWLSLEVQNFHCFQETLDSDLLSDLWKSLDRFSSRSIDSYLKVFDEDKDLPNTNTFRVLDTYGHTVVCQEIFPGPEAIEWYNSL